MTTQRLSAPVLWRRVLVAALLVALPFVVAALDRWRVVHSTVRFFVGYSPERFVHGAVWTLPLSALIDTTRHQLLVAVWVVALLVAPYLILAGFPRTVVRFVAGHVSSTLVVLVAVVVTSAAGWRTATQLYSTTDMGVSAGAAAVAGAFGVLLWRTKARWLAVPALVIPLYFYTYHMHAEAAPRLTADVEHLIAFTVGIAIEVHWSLARWPERTREVEVAGH